MKTPLLLAMASFGLLFVADAPEAAAQQSGRARVLVAPLQTGNGVRSNFGEKVADEVRKNIGDFPTMASIEEKEVKAELKRLKLNEKELGAIQWRQLAGRMNAQVVMFGTVAKNGSGNAVNVAFIDAKTGDELAVPEFIVAGDGNSEVKESATTILTAFESHVDYQQSVLFCQDYLQAEQYEDALRNCEKALEMNPGSTSATLYMGSIYVGMEEWDKALPHLEMVVADNPAETSALQLLAYTHAHLGNMERATELYREYLNFNPADAEVRLSVAFNLAQAGGHGEAIALLQEGIALDDTNPDLWKFLGDVALNKGTTFPEGTEPAESGVSDEAAVRLSVEAYEKVMELRGEDVGADILQNVVAAYLAIGDYPAALGFADRALAMVPDNAALWSSKADVLGRQERFDEAAASLDKVLEIDPAYPNAVLRRGLFRLRGGDTEAAKEDFRAAVASGSDPNIIAQQLLARGHRDHFQKKQYAAAIDMFMAGTEFATEPGVRDQLYFFSAYGYYQQGVGIDKGNASEQCAPARRALGLFQQVEPNLQKSGSVQRNNQGQIRESTDVYVYRQQQIIRKSC
ncbi:MAG: tetratricopeptide repeat protein [Gemmatimonadota bacterium]